VKTNVSLFAIGLAASLSLVVPSVRADLEVSASVNVHAEADFYAPLAPQGEWIATGPYGRCWHPAGVAVGWQPYCDGHWEWTDCGWYWTSDEPWAWACYHYGSWVYDPVHFWLWVPGVEWAPAWVTWRVGGGYVGWAPLPPHRVSFAVPAPSFVFVQSARFHEQMRPATVIVNITTIMTRTTVINNITRETRTVGRGAPQKVVINNGPGVEMIQKATGRQIKPVPIQEAARRTVAPSSLSHEPREFKNQERPSSASEPSRPVPDQKVNPPEKERPPAAPTTPPDTGDRKQPPAKPDLAPEPERRPSPSNPPGKPSKRPKEAPQGKANEQEREGHGKDKP